MVNKQTTKQKNYEDKDNDLSDVQKLAAQCWFAEFESLRNLVLNCQRMMHNLIWINISIIGAILTVYFAYTEDITIFLAIPIVSSLLGIYWCAQGIQITQMGGYIKGKIAPALQKLSQNDNTLMKWEDYIREGMRTGFRSSFIYAISFRLPRATGGLIFVVSSVTAIIVTGIDLGGKINPFNDWQLESYAWWGGLILTGILIFAGYKLGQAWIKPNKEQNT